MDLHAIDINDCALEHLDQFDVLVQEGLEDVGFGREGDQIDFDDQAGSIRTDMG